MTMQDTKLTSVVVAQPPAKVTRPTDHEVALRVRAALDDHPALKPHSAKGPGKGDKGSFRECLGCVFRPHQDLSSRHPAMLNPSTMHLHPTAAPTLLLPLPGSDRSLVAS